MEEEVEDAVFTKSAPRPIQSISRDVHVLLYVIVSCDTFGSFF